MNVNYYRRIKRERQRKINDERNLIKQYLKYENMLKQDKLYSRQRGARIASRLQNNKVLSELLGYESYTGGHINIHFEGLDKGKSHGHEIIETNSTDKCMICGGPLRRHYPYHGTTHCKECNLYSYYGGNHPWSFYEKGNMIEESLHPYETVFEDDFFKLTSKIEIRESTLQNCCCKWKEFRKKIDATVDAYIKIPVYKPVIYVQDYSVYNLGNVEFAHDINPAHTAVLGWRRIPLNWGSPS